MASGGLARGRGGKAPHPPLARSAKRAVRWAGLEWYPYHTTALTFSSRPCPTQPYPALASPSPRLGGGAGRV
ncbi:hypothetical protein PHLCEN_2v9656 [Hermanssonia centrifuga]|uniref:Uncharacterized protein n=1 Tax=Hermanssonia centrifuga TaxID=98765 RepID=A0A2R6NQ98_9APHY|nr:hypothetical protein PHLCEN_2v9656 [Hermanssonia centrifuga]